MRSKSRRIVTVVVTVVGALTASTLVAGQTVPGTSAYRPVGTAPELGLPGYAKVLCSAVFVSGRDKPGIFFTPVTVTTTLPDAMSQPWPMGDRLPNEPLPPEIDRAPLDAAVEAAFDPAGLTTAFVVVDKGRLVAERYMPGTRN